MPGRAPALKWPNDILLAGDKLAGILLERASTRVVIGFGVNLASAPALSDRQCASLGGAIGPGLFAPLLADSFARLLSLWRTTDPPLLAQAWLARAHPLGTPLAVHSGSDATIRGRFAGLASDGALRLKLEDGSIELVHAGDVEL